MPSWKPKETRSTPRGSWALLGPRCGSAFPSSTLNKSCCSSNNGNGADLCPRRHSVHPRAPLLHVIVEEKLIRMRPQSQSVVLFAFGCDPHVQKILSEHVA